MKWLIFLFRIINIFIAVTIWKMSIIRVFHRWRSFSLQRSKLKRFVRHTKLWQDFVEKFWPTYFLHTSKDQKIRPSYDDQTVAKFCCTNFGQIIYADLKCWMLAGNKYSSITNALLKTLDPGDMDHVLQLQV